MVNREPKMWEAVYSNLNLKRGDSYDKAVEILVDLKDLATFLNKSSVFKERMAAIKSEYGNSRAVLDRLLKAKVG